MYTSEFSKHGDPINGFTFDEALTKKREVDIAHGVYDPDSKWKPSEVVKDPNKKSGYMVVIKTKV